MVAKISTGSSLYGAVMYNESKVENESGKVLLHNRIFANLEGDIDAQSVMYSFNLHLLNNQQTEKPIVHISLNPHPDDVLTDEQLRDIASEYMERMGYGEQPYIVYKHEDIERGHIHIITTNVDKNGKKLSNDNNFYQSKKITRDIEDKYGLRKADKKTKAERQAFTFKRVDATKGNVKIDIGNVIKPIAATYKFQSFGEYRTLLSLYNISVEESKGVRGGRAYEGLIYYATNDKGDKISNPFKSSLYGSSVGYKSIHEKCDKHKATIKDKRLNKQTAQRVLTATNGISDRERFVDALKRENIDVIFRENDTGRIYGATFIDHNNHCVFNGSRLGKEFSANAINDRFSEPQSLQPQTPEPKEQQYQDDDFSFGVGGLFDLPADGADDPEETQFRRRMQRKKKKSRRL